jgi:hypothetical protein
MAKDKAKKPEAGKSSGGKKSSRWSAQTQQNKARRATNRLARFERIAERRASPDWVNPFTGKLARGGTLRAKREAREAQAVRIDKKARQRRNFSALSFADKDDHRTSGFHHCVPRSILRGDKASL